jgi:hypothetical protein
LRKKKKITGKRKKRTFFLLKTDKPVAGDTYNNGSSAMPGEGLLAQNGVYAYMVNLAAVSVFYG